MIRMTCPALFLVLAACGGGDDGVAAAPDAEPGAVLSVSCAGATIAETITTAGFNYSPESVTISVGEIVQFTPEASHNVNGDEPGLTVGFGGDACFSFEVASTYAFHCDPHGFTGSVIVN